jgi:hypothetical protein
MRSIEDISKRKSEGKKKWGADLIKFVQPYLDDGLTIEEVIIWLKEQHDIEIDLNEFKRIKSYYKTKAKQNTPITSQNTVSTVQQNTQIQPLVIQNQDVSKTELENLYNDLMGDEDIVEKQKRENEELLLRNSKGPKWW